MKNAKFEIYEGLNKRKKKYIVARCEDVSHKKDWSAFLSYGKRFFRCSLVHLRAAPGYVYEDELYFENPAKPGARLVKVLTYVR